VKHFPVIFLSPTFLSIMHMREIRMCSFVFVLEQIMTSFPVPGEALLSPLSHELESLSVLPNGLCSMPDCL